MKISISSHSYGVYYALKGWFSKSFLVQRSPDGTRCGSYYGTLVRSFFDEELHELQKQPATHRTTATFTEVQRFLQDAIAIIRALMLIAGILVGVMSTSTNLCERDSIGAA